MLDNIDNILDTLIKENTVTSIYTNYEEKDRFSLGFVKSYDETGILLYSFETDGRADGYVWKRKNDIYRIDYDDLYAKKLKNLFDSKNQKFDNINLDPQISILENLITLCQEKNLIVEIDIDESHYGGFLTGKIISTTENNITLKQFTNSGEYDGITIFQKSDIVSFCADSCDGRNIAMLAD